MCGVGGMRGGVAVSLAGQRGLVGLCACRYILRMSPEPGAGARRRWAMPRYVVWPALIGLVLCLLAVLGYRLDARNNAYFSSTSAQAGSTVHSFRTRATRS